MDEWTDATRRNGSDHPTLRAVAGHAVRVVPRAGGVWDGEDPIEFAPPAAIRVLIVGDDVLARRGVLAALNHEPGLAVVGEHATGPAVLTALATNEPDVVLLHGLRAEDLTPLVAAARGTDRVVRVLGIGTRDGEALASPDVCGSLPASATPEEVVAAVRIVAAGFALRRADDLPHLDDPTRGRHVAVRDGLSERECDVLVLVARGLSNGEIAEELTVSEHTVKSHVRNLLSKLGLRNRIHAVIYAFESGLAGPAAHG